VWQSLPHWLGVNKLPTTCAKQAPKERLITFGQAIRRLKLLDEKYARVRHFDANKIIEADREAAL